MVIVAGAPYYEPAKEREGAPSFLPRCSCPFSLIFPSFFLSALRWAGLSLYILGMVLAKLEKPKIEKAEGYIKRALPILMDSQKVTPPYTIEIFIKTKI